ncbi:uncharacterized protein LOC135836652 [Planococcus citri]|uniref:uncharacterized protein LOC135836652 n=1 Tax=Planococcus citri TaxID=170843 RepID=UPI0031FA3FB2
MDTLFCKFCKKNYSRLYNFKVHLRKFHPKVYAESDLSKTKPKFDQKCPLCDFSSKVRNNVEKHLVDFHHIEEVSNYEILHFASNDEFARWKKDIETSSNTGFVQPCGAQRSKNIKTTYYYCNRSGYFVPKGLGKRALRTQGSSKINGVCPAKIKKIEKEDGIEVHYLDIHIGHTADISHLRLQKEERDEIALKIAQNISFDTILQDIRQSVETGEKIERLKLLSKKDLWNIKYSYTANGTLPHMIALLTDLEKPDEKHSGDENFVEYEPFIEILSEEKPDLEHEEIIIENHIITS